MRSERISIIDRMGRDVFEFKKTLIEKREQSNLDSGAISWVNGLVNVLESKTMIQSNIEDLFWFYENGLNQCSTVLDLGCGGGYITLMLSRLVNHVTGFEYIGKWVGQQFPETSYRKAFSFSHLAARLVSERVSFHFYESFPLDIPNGAMDAVVLYAVLEHLHPSIQRALLADVRRILKPGGRLFIAKLPRKLSYQEHLARILGLGGHDRLYSRKMARNVLESNGFQVQRLTKSGLFFNHPNGVVNAMFPFTSRLEGFLTKFFPPVKIFSHDYRLVAIKNDF